MADDGDGVEVTSPIIMKIDAPPEEDCLNTEENIVNEKLEDSSSNSSPMCTVISQKPSLVSPSNFGTPNPFSMKSSVLSSPKFGILRPSQLDKKTENTKSSFNLTPSRLNPFAKVSTPTSTSDLDECKSEASNGDTGLKFVPLVNTAPVKQVTSTSSTTPSSSSTISTNTTTTSSTANFVFGQNLHERVVAESENASDGNATDNEASCSNSNGSTEMLFSVGVKKDSIETIRESKSLTESAREYEERSANKRKYVEVEVITGEEEETNVLQIQCKLFAFDKAGGTWQERGRGVLRLNDKTLENEDKSNYTQSRLVVRSSGNLRVVLNTKIWADMVLDKASARSIRLTALDGNGEIKVFLVMANPDEINKLHKNLETRLNKEIERQKQITDCSPHKIIKGVTEN